MELIIALLTLIALAACGAVFRFPSKLSAIQAELADLREEIRRLRRQLEDSPKAHPAPVPTPQPSAPSASTSARSFSKAFPFCVR